MANIKSLLGDSFISKTGTVSLKDLDGKYIALYFSASWCPPCQNFTPKLIQTYETALKPNKNVEVIFVSSDSDTESFNHYYGKMPWLAIAHDDPRKPKLAKQFGIQGIPTLVVLDPERNLVTKKGVEAVSKDPSANKFPWAPKSFWDLLQDPNASPLINAKGEKKEGKSLKDGTTYLGIYFSAHWCPPCRKFTPELAKTYNKLKSDNKPFEVLFVSADKSQRDFDSYLKEMPWWAFDFDSVDTRENLGELFEIEGYPTMIILDNNANIVTGLGREEVMGDPDGKDFPWVPSPFNILSEKTVNRINESPALIAFSSSSDEQKEKLLANLAKQYETIFKNAEKEPVVFFFSEPSHELNARIKQFVDVTSLKEPFFIILDIPSQLKYVFEQDFNEQNITDAIKGYLNESLVGIPLGM